jgi:hypothetical protein
MTLKIPFGGGLLAAVPAVHYRHVFAARVYRSCLEERPDAIAVELGPHTAAAIWCWLNEITEKTGVSGDIPVMLGLTKPNRMIRPELRERAMRLQRELNLDLSELPPDILNRELECADHYIACLTPTDSIIEAIRCSIEFGIPLYGIDLERTARGRYESKYLIEDPAGSKGRFSDYVASNEDWLSIQRDDPIDTRREIAMAARLKGLLERHRQVLFTCGIGHWKNLRNLLDAGGIRPSHLISEASRTAPAAYRRICVHPLIAVQFMDAFPAMVGEYQKWRRRRGSAGLPDQGTPTPSPSDILRNLLMTAYRKYFTEAGGSFRRAERQDDLEGIPRFEHYLENLCLLNLRTNPDFHTVATAARETMSRDFVKAVVKELLDFPWTTPDDHADCGVLVPERNRGGSINCSIQYAGEETGEPLILATGMTARKHDAPYDWEWLRRKALVRRNDFVHHTWVPWERLVSSLSLRAIGSARSVESIRTSLPFEGSMLDGIDVKSTVRSFARGEDKLFVRDVKRKTRIHGARGFAGFPIVWILDQKVNTACGFSFLFECGEWIRKYVKDPARFEEVRKSRGSDMVAIIAYGEQNVETAASAKNPKIRSDRYQGMVLYQPICWTREQFAHWVESTGYRRNPFSDHGLFGGDFVRERAASLQWKRHAEKPMPDWETALILLAIPFAKGIVTVVAPDDFRIDPGVHKKARTFGVELRRVSLRSFSTDEIEALAIGYMTPGVVYDPACIVEESIEEAIGQKQTENEHLVPRYCLDFGR